MIKMRQALVVEGVYDKTRLSALVDTLIIPTNGFGIFKDHETTALLRSLAKERGVVILTDSDSAGFLIRNRLKQLLQEGEVYHAYIPDIKGKEKRKPHPSAEGKLGVEGMTTEILQKALVDAGITCDSLPPKSHITKSDLMLWGLSGGPNAATKRVALQQTLGLPARMSANTLVEVLCRLYTKEEIESVIQKNGD
ncbi:MAG: DUF4093 domain-containing protein [Clostridia bacterium]|nr:DUF4093 domain-containing protein [Clostridia bacterium]